MWIYFDENGTLIHYLDRHGPTARVGSTDFQIFAFFDNVDLYVYNTATIKFVKDDFNESGCPTLFMTLIRNAPFVLNEASHETEQGVYPFVPGHKYTGLFDFANFNGGQDVSVLLDTPGKWRAVITLYATVDGVEEKNADIVTKVKLRHELGKANADIILNELNKIRIMFNMSSGDGYGHAFEIFSIAVLYNLDYEYTYHNYIVHGKNDGKIDAIYWNSDVVSLYQIKLDLVEVDVKEDIRKNYLEFLDCSNISSSNTDISSLSYLLKISSVNFIIFKSLGLTQSHFDDATPITSLFEFKISKFLYAYNLS